MTRQESSMRPAYVATRGMTWNKGVTYVWNLDHSIQMTILGEPASKSNSRNFSTNRRTGRISNRKSDKALSYVESFLLQVPPEFKGLALGSSSELLRANVSVWYASWKPDVDVELIWDCLQQAGVVSNDRWIREKFVYGAHIDKDNPRVEIGLEVI